MEIKVRTEGALFDASQREAIFKEEITKYLVSGSKRMEAAVALQIPVNTGATRGAVFSAIRGVAHGRGEAFVSLPVEHAEVLEQGSKPHWPPYDPASKTFPHIYLWVQQRFRDKGGSIRMGVKELRRKGARATFAARQDRALRSLTFLIARKISIKGTRARRMFALTKQAFEPILLREWEDVKAIIARRLSEK
jgi:hypothetical protein